MHSHPDARLTPIGRERLIRRHLDDSMPLKALAAQAGISLRSAYKWLARSRDGGVTALADRRSVRRTSGGRSICSNCNRLWTSGTSAALSGALPRPSACLWPPLAGS